jgi:glycosyltransferase involved in cell wall biosynthesis
MKISVVTAVFNRCVTVAEAIEGVQNQSHEDIEHVVIDGASTDGTLEILHDLADHRTQILSAPDDGIYDALNKGVSLASGDVIGIMHSDDMFASSKVLERVAREFEDPNIDAVYGDLQYVSATDPNRVIRHWRAGEYSSSKLARGWTPPHPTLYLRREVFERLGSYDASYQISGDYDAILRWFGHGRVRSVYVPEVFVLMRLGGESNGSLGRIIRKSRDDYRARCRNEMGGLGTLAMKNLRKLRQFI